MTRLAPQATPPTYDTGRTSASKPEAVHVGTARNRTLWLIIFIGVCTGAWFSGERILYLSAVVLLLLPPVSYGITFLLLRGLGVSRSQPESVMKYERGTLTVVLHNNTFMPLGSVEVIIKADEHAVKVLKNQSVPLNPFGKHTFEIPFQIEYRGHYGFGPEAVKVTDITGLFKLRRGFDGAKTITSLPLVRDLANFPLTVNLMTQASSRYDIRDEDYSTVSDIRQYMPTDSVKRVHWKLTAKRNEWLVKNFQSNALNLVSIIFDTTRAATGFETNTKSSKTGKRRIPPTAAPKAAKAVYVLEDNMVENALGLAKFCLGKSMPANFLTTDGRKINARNPAEFTIIYEAASVLRFTEEPPLSCQSILARELNEASGYVNAVVITAKLNAALYERIVNGAANGHFVAVLYFEPPAPDEESPEIFKLLKEGGMPCFKM